MNPFARWAHGAVGGEATPPPADTALRGTVHMRRGWNDEGPQTASFGDVEQAEAPLHGYVIYSPTGI